MASLSNSNPTAGANAHARALCQQAHLGQFDAALSELTAAQDLTDAASPLLVSVRDTVASELARRACHLYVELTPRAVHALGIAPLTTKGMVVDPDGHTLHLVTGRELIEDAIGEQLHTACGQELWSDLEAPLMAGMRGSWQSPEAYRATPCSDCAPHAADFPAAQESPGDANLTPAVAEAISATVTGRLCNTLNEQMAEIAPAGAVPALETAAEHYHRLLTEELAAQAHAGGDELLRRVLMRYYGTARRELDACGHSGPLSELVDEAAWREAVSNALEDLQEADNGAVAQSYLYGEMRSILGARIRQHRPQPHARP